MEERAPSKPIKLPPLSLIEEEGGGGDGKGTASIRRKLMQQIKRVANHSSSSSSNLKCSTELESSRSKRFSLKQAACIYQELLLTKLCQTSEPRVKLVNCMDGFFVEAARQLDGRVNIAPIEIEFTENDKLEYEREFVPKEHYNYLGEDEANNIVAVSVVRRDSVTDFKALVRTEQKDENVDIHRATAPALRRTLSKHEIIEALKPKMTLKKLVKTDSVRVKENLIILEKAQFVQNYKFGIVYCGENQVDENDMFSNVSGSAKWDEFLAFMGETITLKDWRGFSGGLDTHNNNTGEQTVFASWREFQTIFHVSTMLPYHALDPQKLERKRHIGNDVVIIVFKESGQPYSPITITSHFIHIIIVIEPVEIEEKTFYRMEVACKNGVPPFGPQLTQPYYAKDDYFRDFIFAKLINGERAAYHAPAFRPKITRTRSQILKSCGEMVNDKRQLRNSSAVAPPSPTVVTSPRGKSNGKLKSWSLFKQKSKLQMTAIAL